MTVLCPQDPPRRDYPADRTAARMITPAEAEMALQSLWDSAASCEPEAMDECAALETSTRLSAIHKAHRARRGRALPPCHRLDLIRQASALLVSAEEFQSVAEYL